MVARRPSVNIYSHRGMEKDTYGSKNGPRDSYGCVGYIAPCAGGGDREHDALLEVCEAYSQQDDMDPDQEAVYNV